MAFCFVVGTKDFTKALPGYERTTAQCQNCGNLSAHPIQSWNWFTFCFIPVLPLGGKHRDVACQICRFRQDMKNRPDIQSQQGAGGAPPQHHQQGPPQNYNQNQGAPPGQGQQPYYK